MARRERRALARRTLARFAARAAQGRAPARVDRGEKLSTGRVQGEGRLDDGARISRRGARLQGRGAQQIARARRPRRIALRRRPYSAGAGGGSEDAVVAGPRKGRSSISRTATSAATRKMSAATNTQRNTAVMSTPAAPAVSTSSSTPAALGRRAKAGQQNGTHHRHSERARE